MTPTEFIASLLALALLMPLTCWIVLIGFRPIFRRDKRHYQRTEPIQMKPDPDPVNHPKHYTSHPSGIEPIEICAYETFYRGNILKYVMRAPYKGCELQDLKKAQQYLEWEISRIEEAQS